MQNNIFLILIIVLSVLTCDVCMAKSSVSFLVGNVPIDDIESIENISENTRLLEALHEEEMANEAFKNAKFVTVLDHLNRALNLYDETTADSIHIASLYSTIAYCLSETNEDADEVIRYYNLSAQIYEKNGLKIEAIIRLTDIRSILYQLGKTEDYSEITNRIDSIVSSLPPSAELYGILGDEQYKNQNFSSAIPFYEKAKLLYEKEGYDKNYNSYWSLCYNLMNSFRKVQRYQDAIDFGNELMTICEKNEKESLLPLALYQILLTQTNCYVQLEDPDGALHCAEIAQKKLGDNPDALFRNVPVSLMINVYKLTGNYEKMLEYSLMSDSILSPEFDDTHYERINVLIHRINALSSLGRYREAVALSRHKREIKKEIYTNNIEEYKQDLYALANTEAFSGFYQYPPDMDSAKIHMAEYARMEESDIRKQAPWLNSQQREGLWSKTQRTLLGITGFAVQAGAIQEEFIDEVYNAHLLASGLLLQTEKAITEAIALHGTPEAKTSLNQLISLRDSLSLAERDNDTEKQAEILVRLRLLEQTILSHIKELTDYEAYLNTNFDDIKSSIEKGSVFVDFLEMPHTQNTDKSITAFIIRPEWKHPHLMRICRYSEINQITDSYNARLYDDEISQSIRHLVLDSVLHYIKPGELFYYVPDGILHSFALENLKTDDGMLISEVYDMRRLSSAREIAKIDSSNKGDYKNAILYGSLDYGYYNSTGDSIPVLSKDSINDERGVGDAYEPLRATEYEIKSIDSILKSAHIKTISYRNTEGTEESFRALDGKSPDIIHMATHGYYLSAEQAKKVKGLAGYSDAMLLSGLVMSGGNAGWLNIAPHDGSLDGLLTAQDIAELDLSNTKLVVLSACKTANGQNKTDGIFGLQRAFKKAGAGALIMTLWGVNDQITALFMNTFYQELVNNNWDRHKAFLSAKKKIKGQYSEPYFWAGFVMLD